MNSLPPRKFDARELRIIKLYFVEGKTYREILKLERVNPKTLSGILSRAREAIDKGELTITEKEVIVNPPKPTSIIAQPTTEKMVSNGADHSKHQTITQKAFKILDSGGTVYDLVMKLGLEPEEARKLQKQYWEVKGLDLLNDLEEALGPGGVMGLYQLRQKLAQYRMEGDDYASALKEFDQVRAGRLEIKGLEDKKQSLNEVIAEKQFKVADLTLKEKLRNKLEAECDQYESRIAQDKNILDGIHKDPFLSRAAQFLLSLASVTSAGIPPQLIQRVAELIISAADQDKTVTTLLSGFSLRKLLFSNDLLTQIAQQVRLEEAGRRADESLMTYAK